MIELKTNITNKSISPNVAAYVLALKYLCSIDELTKEKVFEGIEGLSAGNKSNFLKQIHSLPLVHSSLDKKERTTLNMIWRALEQRSAKNKNCKDILPTPDNVSVEFVKMSSPNQLTHRYELRVFCPLGVTCDLDKIICTIGQQEVTANRLGVYNNKVVYSYVYFQVANIPTKPITVNCNFKDKNDSSIANLDINYTF